MNKNDEIKTFNDPSALYGDNYTYADYLQFAFDEMVEIIRGKVFRMTPAPNSQHQEISSNLHGLLFQNLSKNKCKLFHAPFDVILPLDKKARYKSNTIVQPDLCIICDLSKIEKSGCFGAPDLIVEIISPHTSKKDLEHKYSVYEEAGVKEYWVVIPEAEAVQVFILQEDGMYRMQKAFGKKDEIQSFTFPELKIPLDAVFTVSFD